MLTLKHKKDHFDVSFIVVDSKSVPILGLATSESLNLTKRISAVNVSDEQFLSGFSDCFGKIGTLKNTHHIEIKDNVTPVVTPVRKIPFALKPKLEKELKRMVDLDIIEPVQKPTDWANGLVAVENPSGKLSVCLEPRPLNKTIKREHLHLPTAEEISQMSGASYFSKLDASSGYWQIKVDEQSSNLLTFGTPSGRYCFKRLLYGIHSASDVFQSEVTSIISNIPGSANSQDDFVVWGITLQEHHERLRKVFLKIRESGLKLNKTNCQIRKQLIVFLGHIFTSEGIKIDPSKTEAVTKILLPRSVNELQRFLGMVNYLGKFIPNLAEHTTPLRNLLKKDVVFELQKPQLDAIENLKTSVTAPCLKIFDSKLPTRLKTDASSVGLGAFLEQNYGTVDNEKWHPIGYSSRALQDYEKRYVQTEKETLSIVFGVERFHEYFHGRRFIVISDHKPVKSIFNRSIISCPPRIQKFFLRVQKYDFELQYSPG